VGLEALAPGRRSARYLGAIIQFGANAGWVIDLNRILAIKLAYDDVGAPEAEADSRVPHDMLTFLKLGRPARLAARVAIDFATDALDRYDAPDLLQAGVMEPASEIRVCAPVQHPGKIIGVANNYLGSDPQPPADSISTEPCFFLKAPSAVIGANDQIKLPAAFHHVDFEGALAVIIGMHAQGVSESEALAHVAGYCVANDVTARDLKSDDHAIGKSCDTFSPLGPALVTPDEVPNPQELGIRSILSGDVLQFSTTKEMRFSVAKLISSASRIMTLDPGDVILTGTPSGTGADQRPQRWLRDGDVVEIEIDAVGRLTNYVAKV
jgi:2-keto-4-pentenoate hydratase/2-oxohepta-3-ene-1,7-dioic acid hydratase in catechol pathway